MRINTFVIFKLLVMMTEIIKTITMNLYVYVSVCVCVHVSIYTYMYMRAGPCKGVAMDWDKLAKGRLSRDLVQCGTFLAQEQGVQTSPRNTPSPMTHLRVAVAILVARGARTVQVNGQAETVVKSLRLGFRD